jgi:hypothetical protein
MHSHGSFLLAAALLALPAGASAQATLYASDGFVVSDTAVHQAGFDAVAHTAAWISTSYPRAAREVNFKFSIDGADNERVSGEDHMLYLRPEGGRFLTPVYTFGVLDAVVPPDPREAVGRGGEGPAQVTFRLDMRHVLRDLREQGAYDPPNGAPVTASEFRSVYIVGNVAPLSWDFGRLRPGSPFELRDPDGDGIYAVTLPFEATYNRPLEGGRAVWRLRRDLGRFPAQRSPHRLVDALHHLALEETAELIRADSTFMAGAKWPEVWTRDLAWGTLLGLVFVAPAEVRRSLAARVDSAGRIVQDGGTGGSWPVSTDRVAWTLAAWELYAATGDREWLRFAFDAARRSAEADRAVAFDAATSLYRGETSFMDWREQSYPRWMEPRDIYESRALSTNVLHYGALRALAAMARELGEPAARWAALADTLRAGIVAHLWREDEGHFDGFLYGRTRLARSSRAEALGDALAVVLGAVDGERAARLTAHSPVTRFGVPSFWPYLPNVPPYHNAGIWPQVVGFRAWAAAEAGNAAAVEHALGSLHRTAALFLTNKENLVAATGHFEGTEFNSDRLIGSVGASLAVVYRVLFGLRLLPDRLAFQPFVPEAYAGARTLERLRYRDAILHVTVRGHGSAVREVRLDGRPVPRAEVPAGLAGEHRLEITLDGRIPPARIRLVDDVASPATPRAYRAGGALAWSPVEGAVRYLVHAGGAAFAATTDTLLVLPRTAGAVEWQVAALDARGLESFLSEPVRIAPPGTEWTVEPAGVARGGIAGGKGAGYVQVTPAEHTTVPFTFTLADSGEYALELRYANGAGPVNYGDRAVIRSVLVDGERAGAFVLPQRGIDRWDDLGYGSILRVRLAAGEHTVSIVRAAHDRNMNGVEERALLDHLRITRLEAVPGAGSTAPAGGASATGPDSFGLEES